MITPNKDVKLNMLENWINRIGGPILWHSKELESIENLEIIR